MRNRYYSPNLGRFITPDPIGLAGGDVNWYRYCGNDGIVNTDINGLACNVIGLAALPNGCGGDGWFNDIIIPDKNLITGTDYTYACILHDISWSVAGVEKSIGDEILRRNGAPFYASAVEANVLWLPEHFYNKAQKEAVDQGVELKCDTDDERHDVNAVEDAIKRHAEESIVKGEDGVIRYKESLSSNNSDSDADHPKSKAKKGMHSSKQRNSSRQTRNQPSTKDAEADNDDDELSPDQIPDPDNDNYVWCEDVCGEEGLRPVCPADTTHCIYWGCSRCGHVIRKKARKAKRQERIWKAQGIDGVWHGTQFDIRQAKSVDE